MSRAHIGSVDHRPSSVCSWSGPHDRNGCDGATVLHVLFIDEDDEVHSLTGCKDHWTVAQDAAQVASRRVWMHNLTPACGYGPGHFVTENGPCTTEAQP